MYTHSDDTWQAHWSSRQGVALIVVGWVVFLLAVCSFLQIVGMIFTFMFPLLLTLGVQPRTFLFLHMWDRCRSLLRLDQAAVRKESQRFELQARERQQVALTHSVKGVEVSVAPEEEEVKEEPLSSCAASDSEQAAEEEPNLDEPTV